MGGGLLSSLQDNKPRGPKGGLGSSKSIKPQRHTSKQACPHRATHGISNSRQKRAWKACERCRMKKTKCDGEFPCKRCKDDGLVCIAGARKKMEYKQLPKGYAEVLEDTQLALVATVHKLYAMVRSQQQWDHGEPDLNDRGQPVIHNIASKLGCIRPDSDIDLLVHSIFPEDEDEAGMTQLARHLKEPQKERESAEGATTTDMESQSSCNLSDRSSPSENDPLDLEEHYPQHTVANDNAMTTAPQVIGEYDGLDVNSVPLPLNAATLFPSQSQLMVCYPPRWIAPRVTSTDLWQQSKVTSGPMSYLDLLNQGLLESDFGTIKYQMVSCPDPGLMKGVGDPMMFPGYDTESMQF